MISLPYDIIFEILLRLRVKTLFRFQCVSKSWSAIISDPDFRKAHRCRAEQNPLLLAATWGPDPAKDVICLHSLDKKGTTTHKFKKTRFQSPSVWDVTACLDLACMHGRDPKWIFCNPATGESVVLRQKTGDYLSTLVFGFGYVSSTKEFKVLHVFERTNYEHSCEVLTLCGVDGRQWKAVAAPPFSLNWIHPKKVAFGNGAIHVLSTMDDGVAVFDLEHEKWSVIPPPPLSSSYSTSLCHLGGFLCVLHCPYGNDRGRFDIWLRKDYKKSTVWVKEYSIDMSELNYEKGSVLVFVTPLAIEQDGRILIHGPGKLHYYDPRGKNHEEIETPEHYFWANLYVESFLSLGCR